MGSAPLQLLQLVIVNISQIESFVYVVYCSAGGAS